MPKEKSDVGSVNWIDLTVENAETLRDFYRSVVGWESDDVDMGGYNDFCMIGPDSDRPPASATRAAPTPACRRSG